MTKQKNVLIIRNAWGFGGAEMYTLNLAKALRKYGYNPIVVTRVPELIEKCSKENIRFIKGLWYMRQGWGKAYFLLNPIITTWYFFVILFNKIDTVHAQGKDDFVFATQAAKLLGKKVVWTDHADLKYIMEPNSNVALRDKILNLARYTRLVVAVSDSERAEILKQSPDFPNLVTIHNGVFLPNNVKPVAKSKKIIIGSTNRLVKAKGIAELINAFAKIEKIDECELWLVGDGEDRQEFNDLAKKNGVEEKVRFLGYQEDIWPYLLSFDIYVQPSYHEAFSLSLIEAAVAGKAIIATRTGGNPEIINNKTGTLVPIKDSKEITRAINNYLKHPKLAAAMASKLQGLATKRFDFDKIVKDKIIPLYED